MRSRKNGFEIDTNRRRFDIELIHSFLSEKSYWATGRSRETIERSIRNSVAFGIYEGEKQVGFGRVITDYATFAWIADVFIIDDYRGKGLGKWLIEVMISHPKLQGFRRWVLATKDAHDLYQRFGFDPLKRPERWMERRDPSSEEQPDYWQES